MIKVIHIRSSGRSGSTLLNILLDRYDQVFAGAELFRYRWLWTRSDNLRSANGELTSESDFWSEVKEGVFPKEPVAELKALAFDRSEVLDLYKNIKRVSGKEIICDTSKSPRYRSIIYDKKHFDPLIVHLIRDGRAVVYSRDLTLIGSLRVAMLWNATNLFFKLVSLRNRNHVGVKYEQLVFGTDACIGKIKNAIESHFRLSLNEGMNSDTSQFAFAGNSMRNSFDGTIEYDSRYIENMSILRWWLCTLIMLPSLLVYKYPLRRSGLTRDTNEDETSQESL